MNLDTWKPNPVPVTVHFDNYHEPTDSCFKVTIYFDNYHGIAYSHRIKDMKFATYMEAVDHGSSLIGTSMYFQSLGMHQIVQYFQVEKFHYAKETTE